MIAFTTSFEGKRVLVTGHTGFKGSWLSLWLQHLKAYTIGFSLPSPHASSHFYVSKVSEGMEEIYGDIRDFNTVLNTFQAKAPELIFHLAAQPIVLNSFLDPKYTFDVNVGGTVNILEAARLTPSVKAIILVTSDKCYANHEWVWGYRENDVLGGDDPYSASKCMAEQAIASYRHSFYPNGISLASARAGNVIGGGDFSTHRILPDCMRALTNREPIRVRHPDSIRAWLYVLDCLSGYLQLASKLLESKLRGEAQSPWAAAWNFGSHNEANVQEIVEKCIKVWGDGDWIHLSDHSAAEKKTLRLNWEKAKHGLKWAPLYNWEEAIQKTVEWQRQFNLHQRLPHTVDMRQFCLRELDEYLEKAQATLCNSHLCL